MTRKRLRITWAGIVLSIIMGIYPPWIRAFEWKGIHSVVSAGYAFIGEPPTVKALVPGGTDDLRYSVVLDWSRLILQWLLVAMVTAMAVLSCPRVERERSKGAAAFIMLFCFAFSMTGCGPSDKERTALERKELRREQEAKIKISSDQISEKYNAISFPPKGSKATTFTYELQRFLSTNAERAVLFKGYLDDVEETERGIVVEFLCPLDEEFYVLNKTAIRFRLIAVEEKVRQLLAVKRADPISRSLLFRGPPEYFIVARIDALKRSRRYELFGSASGDDVELNVEIPPSFMSTGELVEAIFIPSK